jgi:hypothetical protein
MAVPAFSDELATSRLTATVAEGMTRSSCQSFRMRVTKLREALGAVGCAARCSRSTTRVGVESTADTAAKIDSVTIR